MLAWTQCTAASSVIVITVSVSRDGLDSMYKAKSKASGLQGHGQVQ